MEHLNQLLKERIDRNYWRCNGDGDGNDVECSIPKPIDGGWSAWDPFSCDAPNRQTRTCNNPTPQNNGRACRGSTSQVCPQRQGGGSYIPAKRICTGSFLERASCEEHNAQVDFLNNKFQETNS